MVLLVAKFEIVTCLVDNGTYIFDWLFISDAWKSIWDP